MADQLEAEIDRPGEVDHGRHPAVHRRRPRGHPRPAGPHRRPRSASAPTPASAPRSSITGRIKRAEIWDAARAGPRRPTVRRRADHRDAGHRALTRPACHRTPSIRPPPTPPTDHRTERSATTTENVRGAASPASSPPGSAMEGPFSARFPSRPFRGDIPAGAALPGGLEVSDAGDERRRGLPAPAGAARADRRPLRPGATRLGGRRHRRWRGARRRPPRAPPAPPGAGARPGRRRPRRRRRAARARSGTAPPSSTLGSTPWNTPCSSLGRHR